MDFNTLSTVSAPTVPQVSGDGINSVFFSGNVFGDDFGEDVLAVTVTLTPNSDPGVLVEADVVVNNIYHYDSYRGPLQGSVQDIHRILLHEFGHVLGLDHVIKKPTGQAIMEPVISDYDHLGPDDVAGVQYLYGAKFDPIPGETTFRVGDFAYGFPLSANNNPTSFSIVGLPPGLIWNATDGSFTGVPTKEGTYRTSVMSHGAFGDAYVPLQLDIVGPSDIPGMRDMLRLGATSMVADPKRPSLYVTSGNSEIDKVDTTTLAVTKLADTVHTSYPKISLSADGDTLLYYDTQPGSGPGSEYKLDLNTLQTTGPIAVPARGTPVIEGLNNQAYIGAAAGVYQFDATTGIQEGVPFATPASISTTPPAVAISSDRRTLYVGSPAGDGFLASYDISGPVPLLLHKISGFFTEVTPTTDGKYLYYLRSKGATSLLQRATLPLLNTTATLFTSTDSLQEISIAKDGTVFVTASPRTSPGYPADYVLTFDPVTLMQTGKLDLTVLDAPLAGIFLDRVVFDNSGNDFYTILMGWGEVWAFSTDFASYPPLPPTKQLMNISTRSYIGSGEDQMIGGFIIQGTKSKQVVIRGLGPSLPITGALSNPVLDLYDSTGKLIATNDNWTVNRLNIVATQLAPTSSREATIERTLDPGAYTVIEHDARNQPGLGLVEIYDLNPADSLLANISTRGRVDTGDNVMIGGFIIGGKEITNVLIRALGPSLTGQGVTQPLADPYLTLHDGNGEVIATDDNWRATQQSQISATGIAPKNDKEAAIIAALAPGNYTAIVSGKDGGTGVALVEVYNLDASAASK